MLSKKICDFYNFNCNMNKKNNFHNIDKKKRKCVFPYKLFSCSSEINTYELPMRLSINKKNCFLRKKLG